MKYVRLSLTQEPSVRHPMHQFLAETDGFEVSRLLSLNYETALGSGGGPGQTALFHVVGSPVAAYEAALEATDQILEYEISERDDGSFYLYVRGRHTENDEQLVDAVRQQGLVVLMPIEYRADGTIRLTVIGPGETVQRALDELPAHVAFDVRSIGKYDARHFATGNDLTDRQFEAVQAAVDCGYYEEPRTCTVAAVADELGCAPGTAAEHLRRAEATVMADLVSERT